MDHLNSTLTVDDFRRDEFIRSGDRSGFKGTPRVVTLLGPFKLYKLTGDKAPQSPVYGNVTPWWSAVEPYGEDTEGARGRFKQAYMNGIDMSSMVRYMSAVKVEWNSLAEYVEISIKKGEKISCFWGEFAPMALTSDLPTNGSKIDEYSATNSNDAGYSASVLPEELGALSAWQFYIPKLTDAYIEGASARTCIDAHNMHDLGRHFCLHFANVADLRKISLLLVAFNGDGQVKAAMPDNRILMQMGALVETLWSLAVDPQEILEQFCKLGNSYVSASGTHPVREKVHLYIEKAATLLMIKSKL